MNEAKQRINHLLSEFASQFDAASVIGLPVITETDKDLPLLRRTFDSDPICIEDARMHDKLMENVHGFLSKLFEDIRVNMDQNNLLSIFSTETLWVNVFDKDKNPDENLGFFRIRILSSRQ
jgi:hypothetical protein